jgi:hypothetical protein
MNAWANSGSESDSHAFWAALLLAGREAEHYSDLVEMSRSADVLVVGHLESVVLGRSFRDPETGDSADYATASLLVERLLASRPGATAEARISEGDSLSLELFLPERDLINTLQERLSGERAIFFLRDKEREAIALGLPAELQRAERGFYRIVSTQGLLREQGGKVMPPVGTEDEFLIELEGMDFAALVAVLDDRP